MAYRVNLTSKQRIYCAQKQEFKCANYPGSNRIKNYDCPQWKNNNGLFYGDSYQIDHIEEYSVSKNNSQNNLQALCLYCHDNKTKEFISNKLGETNNIIKSKVLFRTFEEYVKENYTDKYDDIMKLHNKYFVKMEKKTSKHIEFIKLVFKNMLSYGNGHLNEINFKSQEPIVVNIKGKNGSGKSSIIDIMMFCLFGKFERGNPSDIINVSQNHFECSVTFRIADDIYRVNRVHHNSKVKRENYIEIFKNNNLISGTSKKKIQTQINNLVGDYDDYLTTHFVYYSDINNVIDMSDINRKKYLFKIFSLQNYSDAYKDVSKKIIQIKLPTNPETNLNKISKKNNVISKQINTYQNHHTTIFDISKKILYIYENINKINIENQLLKLLRLCNIFMCSDYKNKLVDKRDDLQKKYVTKLNKINNYKKKKKHFELLTLYKNIIGPNGYPLEYLFILLEDIEVKVNNILNQICDFTVSIILYRTKINICLNRLGHTIPIRTSSGFEKFICNIIFRLIITTVTHFNTSNLMFIDEGFFQFDDINIENLTKLFNLLKQHFHFIIIFTHESRITNHCNIIYHIQQLQNTNTINIDQF